MSSHYHVPLWFTCLTELSACFEHFFVKHQLLADCFLPYCSDYHFLKPAPLDFSFSLPWCLSCLEGITLSCWHSLNQPLGALGILHLCMYVCSKGQYFCDLTISLVMALDYTGFQFLCIVTVWKFVCEKRSFSGILF